MGYKDLTPDDKRGILQALSNGEAEYQGLQIKQLESRELNRDYDCYFVAGNNIEFLLKYSDSHEAEIYTKLNQKRFKPRLSVPKMYESFSSLSDTKHCLLALEYIRQGTRGDSCATQEDGILQYYSGSSVEAWKSTGEELAMIHSSFWNVQNISPILEPHHTYDGILYNIEHPTSVHMTPPVRQAIDKMKQQLREMPICMVHFDLLPINVLVRERKFSRSGEIIIRPQATFVDWQTAASLPYILDVARITSHCKREEVIPPSELEESHLYCSEDCQSAILDAYYEKLKNHIGKSKDDFMIDYQYGRFFELLRMYHQMPHLTPLNSYDRYYHNNVLKTAEYLISL